MFTVLWHPNADDNLTELWMAADSAVRAEITAASHQITLALRTNPFTVGESREGNDRIAFEGPLGFLFEGNEDDRTVTVYAVWRTR